MQFERRMSRVPTCVGLLCVEESGDGPAIVCWPSLYCDARTLDPVVADLCKVHRVIVVNGPGHGGSDVGAGSLSLAACSDAALEVLDAFGVRQATWLGAAWGGHVGLVTAVRHGERLRGLVILNAPMRPWSGSRRLLMRLGSALLQLFGPQSFVATMTADKMIARSLGPERAALVDAVSSAMRRCDRQLVRVAKAGMFDRADLVPELPKVRVPTLFAAGAEDELFPVEEARAQAALIPDCEFVVVERSSHQSALEAPAQVVRALRSALDRWSSMRERADDLKMRA